MDFLQQLRLNNIFGNPSLGMGNPMDTSLPSMPPTPPARDPYAQVQFGGPRTISPQVPSPDDDYDVQGRMNQIYHPQTAASDRLNQMISDYPREQDYHPTMLRKIGGMLAAVGGSFNQHGDYQFNPGAIAQGRAIEDKPYQDKLQDWTRQIPPIEQAASLERYHNANERSLAYQTVSNELRDKSIANKAKTDQEKVDIARSRARIYQYKAEHPEAKFDWSGPTVKIGDPGSQSAWDTGIPTGHMDEMDRRELEHKNRLGEITKRGEVASDLEDTRQGNRKELQEESGWTFANIPDPDNPGQMMGAWVNPRTQQVKKATIEGRGTGAFQKPGTGRTGGERPELPSQAKIRQANKAREIFNTNPQLRPFIHMGSGNDFTIDKGGIGMFGHHYGPTDEQAKMLQDMIYGPTGGMTPMGSHAPTGATPDSFGGNSAPPAPAGWQYVPKPGGGWTAVKVQ